MNKNLTFKTSACLVALGMLCGCMMPHHHATKVAEPQRHEKGFHSDKMVGDYSDYIAHQLAQNLSHDIGSATIAILPFDDFDLDGDTLPTKLGLMISENLVGQMQRQALTVTDIDFRDYVYSERKTYRTIDDFSYLLNRHNIEYVVSGYLIENERGVAINARLMNRKSRQVLSSASSLIPNFALETL